MTQNTVAGNDLLGDATPTGTQLDVIVSAALGRPAVVTHWVAEPVPYESGSPATGTLARVRGVTAEGQSWSVFLKVLQHPRHWKLLDRMPGQLRADFLGNFPWRAELTAWEPTFSDHLPTGLRMPELYQVVELSDDRVAVWMEDVVEGSHPWTPDRFVFAAEVLGALAANRRDPEMLAACPVPRGYSLRRYYDAAVKPVLPWLQSHQLWEHPLLATRDGSTLRRDLVELAESAPAILDQLDELPQSLPHGDASPQNLLIPRNAPDTLVAIDVAFQCPLAVGFDLAQLLVGLVHAGLMPPSDLPATHQLLAPAYERGMNHGARPAALTDIEAGYIGSLAIRAAFTSLPFREPLHSLSNKFIAERMMLTRFIADLCLHLWRPS